MSFFEELKRRNVIRVAIAYGVAAWFLLQLADLVLENIVAPDWVMQTLMLVMGIGFPLVVIFAWAFEMTPEGIKKEKDVDRSVSVTTQTGRKLDRMIIGVLALAVVYLLVDKLILQDTPSAPVESAQVVSAESEPTTETTAEAGPSIAVLPFVNMSGDKENEYFSDGLTETLLHMLAQLPELRVAARTSSFAFKGKNTSIAEIATTLGVAHILEGSVQKSGDRIRVTAQLIRADDGFHVWSQNYTRPLEDIFAIQDEIAADVATALDSSLLGNSLPDMKGVATTDLDAYDGYLKGLEQQAIFSYGSLNIAENNFKQALAHDPGFTDARLALIRNYLLKNDTGVITEDELRDLTDPLIAQVRQQHPDNRLARAFELIMEVNQDDVTLGVDGIEVIITELRNMLPLIANETMVRGYVAGYLNFLFEQERDAIEVLEAGLLLDPLAADLHRRLGAIHSDHDRLDAALTSLQRAQELAPQNPNNYGSLANLEREKNNLPAALNWERMAIELDPQDHELVAALASELYALELPEEGDHWFARVNALAPGSPLARMVEINRAVAKKDNEQAVKLARSMISDQVEERRGAFFVPLITYSNIMLESGRAKEGYDFLVSVRPEISNYSKLPNNTQGIMMQYSSITLMTGFETLEKRKSAWQKMTANFDALGFPWRDPEGGNLIFDFIHLGDLDGAVDHFLNDSLSQPMAQDLYRHKQKLKPLFGELYSEPRVAARLTELDKEFAQLREDIGELMLEPEWNQ